MAKDIRNALFRNGNHLVFSTLVLSTDHVLESSVFSVKWIRDLNRKNKEKLISNVIMSRNSTCIDDLRNKKLSPELSLFDMNLSTALKDECGEAVKGTLAFLMF